MALFTNSQVTRARFHLGEAHDMAVAAYWRGEEHAKVFHQQEMLEQLGKALGELGFAMVPAEQFAEAAE